MSEDVENRLEQHNRGESKWTKNKGLWTLAWISQAMSVAEAKKLKYLLKRQKGGQGFYNLTGLERPTGS